MSEENPLVRRIKVRYTKGEAIPGDDVIEEMLLTVTDRLLIRLDVDELPDRAASIVVDASMKALRLRGTEGSRSESAADGGSMSNSFIDDVLDAYKDDIAALKEHLHAINIQFLR